MLPHESSSLPRGWKASKLDAVVTLFTGGTPFLKSEYTPVGTAVLTKGDVKPYGRIEHSGRFVDTGHAVAERYRFTEPGDLLVTTRDLTTAADFLGLVAPAPLDKKYLVNQGANVFRLNSELVDSRYFVYWTSGLKYRNYIKSAVSGSTQVHIRKTDWLNAPLHLPPIDEQRRISRVLGALDDKIELNRRMNETLEAMARTIFQSWFVNFDPVHAKANGESPEAICQRLNLTPELLALFPDSFEDSELGETPKKWRVSQLGDLCSYLSRGISPKYVEESGVCVLNQKCIRDGKVSTSSARRHDPTQRSIVGRELLAGDILVNSTGTGTLGRVAQIMVIGEPTIVDSHVTVVRANSAVCAPSYLAITLLERQTEIEALGEGSTGQTELSRARLAALNVLKPPLSLMRAFDSRIRELRETSSCNDQQGSILATTRDALLPKLLSGEIGINDFTHHLETLE